MAKKRKQQQSTKFYRTNERIFAQELRVLDAQGSQIGILSKSEALAKAKELELDLVEIAPSAKPPVARIIDFKKFLYTEEKKKREEKRKAKNSDTKQVRLGPFMSDNDLAVSRKRVEEFLKDGDKVRLIVRFKGRAIIRKEFGEDVINKLVAGVSNISKVDREPHMEGRQMIALISPEKKRNEIKTESSQVSTTPVQNN